MLLRPKSIYSNSRNNEPIDHVTYPMSYDNAG
jgi:hypothetical protein